MDALAELRRKRVKELIEARFGGRQSSFAEEAGVEANYVSRLLNGTKKLGERLARKFEQRLGLDAGWFDMSSPQGLVNRTPPSAWPFRRIDPARFFRLQKSQRKLIEGVVEHMIAEIESAHDVRPRKSRAG